MTDVGLQSLQAAWFTSGGPIKASAGDVYQSIVGEPAATTHSVTAAALSIATGTQGARHFRVQLSPGRIDYFLQSTPQGLQFTPAAPPSSFDLFPNINETIGEFAATCERGSPLVGEVVRIALVVSKAQKMESLAAANKMVAKQIELSPSFDDGTDLLFQINRRKRLSSVPGVEANRIMTWAAVIVAVQEIGW